MAKKAAQAPQRRNPYMDGSGPWGPPALNLSMQFSTVGSSGLRQYSGWVREEFLTELLGRQAARVYREMLDNSPTVGSIIFAIQQTMRQISWRLTPPNDSPEAMEKVEFVESCMDDMSHTWSDFCMEQLSMLPFGFAPHEIVYKRRMGKRPAKNSTTGEVPASSRFDDGSIGWRKIPLRGQDTVIKWFFDPSGSVTGMTQQPWVGGLIDIPIEKLLLFRPLSHKNNPEGKSILRSAYRPWYFIKRLEEQEAIMFERFSGLPKVSVPKELLDDAQNGDANAIAMLEAYKTVGRNIRIDDQMCVIIPSDPFKNSDGTFSSVKMYDVDFATPVAGKASTTADTSINRYKLDIMTSVLADFLTLGHSSRGTQSLANTKVDLFFQATEGWVGSNAEVMNRYGLPRLWALNGYDDELMPRYEPDMPQRTDLDVLSNFILRLSQSGMPLWPDPDLDSYLRDAAGMPDVSEDAAAALIAAQEGKLPGIDGGGDGSPEGPLKKIIAGSIAHRLVRHGLRPDLTPKKAKRKRR